MSMETLPLSECEWKVEIQEINLSGEIQGQWRATCLSMDGIRFANGGVGSLSSVRIFETPDRAKDGWMDFAKTNGIEMYRFVKAGE